MTYTRKQAECSVHSTRTKSILINSALFLYASVVLLMVIFHEPWRDEAQAWLIARDLSIVDIFHHIQYETSPALWHLLLTPFAKLGFPYYSENLLNAAIMITAAITVAYKSPFAHWQIVLLMFSYFFLYEYAVIARSYGLSVMLLMLLAMLDQNRGQRPILYGILVAALANTNVHSLPIALALAPTYYWGLKERFRFNSHVAPGLLMLTGFVFVAYQLPELVDRFIRRLPNPAEIVDEIMLLLSNTSVSKFTMFLAMSIIAVVVLWQLRSNKRLLIIGMITFTTWALSPLVQIMAANARHGGFLVIMVLFLLWLRESEQQQPMTAGKNSNSGTELGKSRSKLIFTSRGGAAAVLFFLAVGLTIPFGLRAVYKDFKGNFSTAGIMASYIKAQKITDPIVAFRSPPASALLPYLPNRKLWYLGPQRMGTYIIWNDALLRNTGKPVEQLICRQESLEGRPHWLLLSSELKNPEKYGYRLEHSTISVAMPGTREIFYLYRPLDSIAFLKVCSER